MSCSYPVPPSLSAFKPRSPSDRSSPTAAESNQILPTINYKFWFDDIHVALVTTDHVVYRVRRDCLESASCHLECLIAEAIEMADKKSPFGCPVVHLDLSSPKLEPFLEVVTDPVGTETISWHVYKRNAPGLEECLSFSWLAIVARTAYELWAYETMWAALSRISVFFKLEAPLKLVKHSEGFQENWDWWGRECGITIDVKHAIEALNLFSLLRSPSQSPLALYACCLLPPAQLRSGVAREDGVVEKLSDADFERCMRALPSLHIANHDNLVNMFVHADDWVCLGAHRSTFPCEGKHGVRKIRDAYTAHMKMHGPYRPDLRDLLSSLKHKSLPYEKLFAPEGAPRSLVCQECMKRLVDISETLCCEEANNLKKYFFPEEEEGGRTVPGPVSPPRTASGSDDSNNNLNAPGELQARTPLSESESESEPEESLRSPADSGSCMETSRPPPRPPSIATPPTLRSGLTTPSPRSSPPASDQGNEEAADEPSSPSRGSDSSKTPFSPVPRVEIEMPAPLALAAIGWDDHSDDSD